MPKWIWVIIGMILVVGLFAVPYNQFVSLDQAARSQWAQVETVYQRRLDLIPNLVATAKGYLKHEKGVLEDLAAARSKYAGAPSGSSERIQAAGQVEGALSRLLVIVENYPNLKANETMAKLMDELAGSENRISVERHRYNEMVRQYNSSIKKFPGAFFASSFGFKEKPYFEAVKEASTPPKVEF